jgi:hypothetical protein
MAIRTAFNNEAVLAATTSLIADDWDHMDREDLKLLISCVAGMDDQDSHYDAAMHILRAARSGIRKALAEGGEKAKMPWAFKNVRVIDYVSGEQLAEFPKLTNPDGTPKPGGWLRPSDLRRFVQDGHHPIVVWMS